jgi:hypothetical protein
VIESFLPCSRCSVQRCSQSVLERPKNHQTHSPQRRAVTQCQNSQHPMAEPENTKEKKRACAKTTKGPPPAPGRCAATTCKSARAASDGFGVPRNEAPLPPKCTMIVARARRTRRLPCRHASSSAHDGGGPAVSPAASSAAPWLPRSVYFMSHRLVRPVPQRTPEREPFVATALSLHQPLSLSLSLSLSFFCLSWARIPFQDLLARFQ